MTEVLTLAKSFFSGEQKSEAGFYMFCSSLSSPVWSQTSAEQLVFSSTYQSVGWHYSAVGFWEIYSSLTHYRIVSCIPENLSSSRLTLNIKFKEIHSLTTEPQMCYFITKYNNKNQINRTIFRSTCLLSDFGKKRS